MINLNESMTYLGLSPEFLGYGFWIGSVLIDAMDFWDCTTKVYIFDWIYKSNKFVLRRWELLIIGKNESTY